MPSHNAAPFIDSLIAAGERLDPVLVNRVLNFTIEGLEAQYEISKPTLSDHQCDEHQRLINTAYFILTLFNCLRLVPDHNLDG
jgi:hypothetical protein